MIVKGHRPLEWYNQLSREDAQHQITCGCYVRGSFCQLGRKLREIYGEARHFLPPVSYYKSNVREGWEEFDKHLPDCRECQVQSDLHWFAGQLMGSFQLIRIAICEEGIRMADDRFERLGYEIED